MTNILRKYCFCLTTALGLILSGCSHDKDPVAEEKGRIIVLLYHRIVDGEPANLYERSAADFESDLNYLISNKIKIISFDDLGTICNSGVMPSGHSAIITFDDGEEPCYGLVLPILKKYMAKATFFLWTEKINQKYYLTTTEIEAISNYMLPGGIRPFTFGSHSVTHQCLYSKRSEFSTGEEYNAFLDYEFRESRKAIEALVPGDVTAFALPFGDGAGDNEIIAAAMRNGYSFMRTSVNAVIKDAGINLFSIPALPILDDTSADEIGYYLSH